MSDIQCAARFFAVQPLPEAKLDTATQYLATQRIAAIIAAATPAAQATAQRLAAALGGLRVQTMPASVPDRQRATSDFTTALGDVADGYRGESVVVVTDESQFATALPGCLGPLESDADIIGFAVDGDGWALQDTRP